MNVVPLVDVVLVLLIIFMVTAHVMESGLDIDVPAGKGSEGDHRRSSSGADHPRRGTLYLNDQPVNINLLGPEIPKLFKGQKSVYVVADKAGRVEQFGAGGQRSGGGALRYESGDQRGGVAEASDRARRDAAATRDPRNRSVWAARSWRRSRCMRRWSADASTRVGSPRMQIRSAPRTPGERQWAFKR